MKRIVLASNNRHKLVEIGRMLADIGVELLPLSAFPELPEPPETAPDFEGNALQKARFVFERTGLPALADDSGLEVDALGGAPGVHSKRWTPEAIAETNMVKLKAEMLGKTERSARFVCALGLVSDKGEKAWRGTVEGQIAHERRGEHGFGYDPMFLPEQTPGRTMAELSPAEKDAISHRGAALKSLPEALAELL